MKIYTLLSQKGGAGKSHLATQLAVISGESEPTYLDDRDPQKTATKWWQRRQEGNAPPPQPQLIDLEGASLTAAADSLRTKPGALFIDTRPAVTEQEAEAARVADIVVVPVRPSVNDLEAVGDTLAMLRRIGRTGLLVVNAAKVPARAHDAQRMLSRYPVAVCPHFLADRAVYLDAAAAGYGVGEMRGAAAEAARVELVKVWEWINEASNV